MDIKWEQGSTQRGVVKLAVALAASWAWYTGNTEQAIGAFTVGSALTGWLGITVDDNAKN